MKSVMLFISFFVSTMAFANEKVLLECQEKYNSLKVIVDGDIVSITRSPWYRGLVYADSKDQTEQNPVTVRGYDTSAYTAVLSDVATTAVSNGKVLITFKDKKSTQLEVALTSIKEGQGVSFKSSNNQLVQGVLTALSAKESDGDLSFYDDNACHTAN